MNAIGRKNVRRAVDIATLAPGAWGNTRGPEDVNRDGIVNTVDMLELLGAWGPCP